MAVDYGTSAAVVNFRFWAAVVFELIPPLDGRAIVQLRGTFAALQRGDIVVIEYTPSRGTSIRVNKGVAVSGIDHDLMLAFLDHWLGQRPVSEEIKRALLDRSS
mgnify:CR=1 FL=1